MGGAIQIFDVLLVIALIGTAWKALFGTKAFEATVFFIAYGLFMALAWVQLGAADVALAEIAIGTGLTGALLIGAIRQFESEPTVHSSQIRLQAKAFVGILCFAVFIGLATAVLALQEVRSPIPSLVSANIKNSGTSHPVTAVLLNFRGFDTWLELGVLLLASFAAIVIHQIYDKSRIPAKIELAQDQPKLIARAMMPVLILVGGVVLWFGSHSPGGAFQAGALIGAAGILLQIGGERSFLRFRAFPFRLALVLGFFMFMIVGTLTLGSGLRLLEYPVEFAGLLILVLEAAAMLSIALTLNVMYACSHPWGDRRIR